MRICKSNEAGGIFGQGSPSVFSPGWAVNFVIPPPPPSFTPLTPTILESSLQINEATDVTSLNAERQSIAQASPPTFTSSMPNTVNTTVAVSPESSGWTSATVTMPSSTTTTTNPTVASSVPSSINPTSNAQPSTPDVVNAGVRSGDLALGVFGIISGLATMGGPVGRAIGLGVDIVANELGIDVGTIAKLENFTTTPATTTVGPFGYPGYVQHGDLGFTAPSVPGTEICGPNYGLDQANQSTVGPSSATPSETGPTSSTLGGSDFGGYDFGGYDYGGYDASSSTAGASYSSSSDSGGGDSGW